MNDNVPSFPNRSEGENDPSIHTTSTTTALSIHGGSGAASAGDLGGDELLSEVVWRKGPVVQSVTPGLIGHEEEPHPFSSTAPKAMFMDEDEMAAYLLNLPEGMAPEFGEASGLCVFPSAQSPSLLPTSASLSPPAAYTEAAMAVPFAVTAAEDRKRKAALPSDTNAPSAGSEEERPPPRKSRSVEVHNLSERRRRDRINEKMRALQELIPRCSKTNKASMLDDAIEYTKTLQMQLQMMSMGCPMLPTMYPGMQQFIPPPAALTGIRPMMPLSPELQSPTLPVSTPCSTPMLPFQPVYPPFMAFGQEAGAQGTPTLTPVSSGLPSQIPNPLQLSKFPDSSYHQYFGHRQHNPEMPPDQKNKETEDAGTSGQTKSPEDSDGPAN